MKPRTLQVLVADSNNFSRGLIGEILRSLNVTNISDVQWDPAVATALGPNVSRTSFGLALQAGVDIPVGGGWLLNLDVKKLQLKTDVSSFGAKVGEFKVDPLLLSLGFGKRF